MTMTAAEALEDLAWDPMGVAQSYLSELRSQAHLGGFDRIRLPELLRDLIRDVSHHYPDEYRDAVLTRVSHELVDINGQARRSRTEGRREKSYVDCLIAGAERDQDRQRLIADLERSFDTLKRPPAAPTPEHAAAKAASHPELTAALRPPQPANPSQAKEPEVAASAPTNATATEKLPTSKPLNARRLRSSVFPTWLALVVTSWISLAWGALLSLPFGVSVTLIASFMGGLIAVPVWATVFGFLGMGAARASTLRSLGFVALPKTHPLQLRCAAFCKALDIPMPTLGTVPVYNAFAMGLDRKDATVAIGEPLLKELTSQQVDAVLAHELGHVVSGDMRRMMLMRTFQNATVWYMLFHDIKMLVRWVICWVAELSILSFSRNREFWADAIGAELAGKEAMVGALRALEAAPSLTGKESTHARFMIRGRFRNVLNTHPSFERRVRAIDRETYLRKLPRQR